MLDWLNPEPDELQRHAEALADEFATSPEACLALLDESDQAAIRAGDAGMLNAWGVAVRAMVTTREGTL